MALNVVNKTKCLDWAFNDLLVPMVLPIREFGIFELKHTF